MLSARGVWLLVRAGLIALLGAGAGFSYNFFSDRGIYSLQGKKENALQISLNEARLAFDEGGVVFVDARYAWDFVEGHIPGAVNIPPGSFERGAQELVTRLPKNAPIITYCNGSSCYSSLALARLLRDEFGFTQVRVLAAGWPAWKEAGYSVEAP
jgi:rhodanese-related sulfurtransferase